MKKIAIIEDSIVTGVKYGLVEIDAADVRGNTKNIDTQYARVQAKKAQMIKRSALRTKHK